MPVKTQLSSHIDFGLAGVVLVDQTVQKANPGVALGDTLHTQALATIMPCPPISSHSKQGKVVV